MSTKTVSPLRQRMIEDMNARKLPALAEESHCQLQTVRGLSEAFPRDGHGRRYSRFQLHLSEAGLSICNRNRIMTGLRFLFRVTLRRWTSPPRVYHIREPQKIPLVMSPDETGACWRSPAASRSACCSVSAMAVDCAQARWSG